MPLKYPLWKITKYPNVKPTLPVASCQYGSLERASASNYHCLPLSCTASPKGIKETHSQRWLGGYGASAGGRGRVSPIKPPLAAVAWIVAHSKVLPQLKRPMTNETAREVRLQSPNNSASSQRFQRAKPSTRHEKRCAMKEARGLRVGRRSRQTG